MLAARIALDREVIIARAKAYALRNDEIKTVRRAPVTDTQLGNKSTIRFLTDRDGHKLSDYRKLCEASHQHFAQSFGESSGVEMVVDFIPYLDRLLRLSAADL